MYSVRVKCPREKGQCRAEANHIVAHDLGAHQLMLPVLYAHTQHGGCGLNVEQDGDKPFGWYRTKR